MKKTLDTRAMVRCALFAALICVLSPFSIQIGPVPITMSLFAVMLCGVALDWRGAGLAVLVYLLIGLVGLPVFSGGKGGAAVLAGATGGYIWSYILCAVIASLVAGKTRAQGAKQMLITAIGCACGVIVCYICGTLQFSAVAGRTFVEALSVCVIPFIIPDLIKCACAAILGTQIKNRIS